MQGSRIGLIGLGAAGTGIALVLAENGYSLLVSDVRPASTFDALLREGSGKLTFVANPAELCSQCSVVLTSLPSVAVIASVAENIIIPNLRGTWIDTSTTDEEEVQRLGPLCKTNGIDLLEAPLTGGVHLVRSGDSALHVALASCRQ